MNNTETVVLLNDSFPPQIDGVANAVMNYATVIHNQGIHSAVLTPSFPDADDSNLPFPVLRYPSIDFRNKTGYMAGIPFSPEILRKLEGQNVSLLHSHCPIASTMLARELRSVLNVPLVMTYHTKFDIDIANVLKSKALQDIGKYALVENVNACDEIWAVSHGAVDNLRSLGYEGECIVMENGVDLPRGTVSDAAVCEATNAYNLPDTVPVYLFVGRLMWYKGLRIIIDALAQLKASGEDFRMVFIGGGADCSAVEQYASECCIADKCVFTGPIYDREVLRAWYCRSDLFLFPSTFDTNGLVVREAAACGLGAVLIRGSCAAEGITDCRNGLLIDENPESLYTCLHTLHGNREQMAQIGQNACNDLYLSWEDSVRKAIERYQIIIDRYRSGGYPGYHRPIEDVFRANGELMDGLAHFMSVRENLHDHVTEHIASRNDRIISQVDRITQRMEKIADNLKDIL